MKSVKLPPFPILVALAVLAMLGLQGLVEYTLFATLTADSAKLGQDIKRLQTQSTKPLQSTTQLRLDDVLSQLQDQNKISDRIKRLHKIAEENSVTLRKAGYASQHMPGDILRHEIQADLAGAYPAIRQFLRAVLAQDQAAAIESLEFGRLNGTVGVGGVRARVRLTLYAHRITP